MFVLTVKDTDNPPRGFLGLPREVRDIIYTCSVVELPKWAKRHNSFCSNCARNDRDFEQPPFTLAYPTIRPHGSIVPQPDKCSCAKRQSLALLLANRQIHVEAAPIFWAMNTHCFDSSAMFARDVGDRLRQKYRECIRHISIMNEFPESTSKYESHYLEASNIPRYEKFWHTMIACKKLRTLELGPEYVKHYESYLIAPLTASFPHLESLNLSRFINYELTPPPQPGCISSRNTKRIKVFVKAARKLSLERAISEASCKTLLREFETNFLIHSDFAIKTEFLDELPATVWRGPSTYALTKALYDIDSMQTIMLRDGTLTTVQILGLPNSPATRRWHSKQRCAFDSHLKAAGKPTLRESKLVEQVRERKEEKKKQKKNDEERNKAKEQSIWKEQKEEHRKKDAEAENKHISNQQVRFRRKMRRTMELKKEERKAVARRSKSTLEK
jgi:hypothetical protein